MFLNSKTISAKDGDLSQMIPWFALATDEIVILKDGSLMATLIVQGFNADASDESELVTKLSSYVNFLRGFNQQLGIQVSRISRKEDKMVPLVSDNVSEFAAAIDRTWTNKINAMDLNRYEFVVSLTLRPLIKSLPFFGSSISSLIGDDINDRIAALEEVTQAAFAVFEDFGVSRATNKDGSLFAYLRAAAGLDFYPLKVGKTHAIGSQVIDVDVDINDKAIVISSPSKTSYSTVLSVKNYPQRIFANVLSRLVFKFPIVISNSWTPFASDVSEARIKRVGRQMKATDSAALSAQQELLSAADDVASGQDQFGDHQLNILVFADSLAELEKNVAVTTNALQKSQIVVSRDGFTLSTAFFSFFHGGLSKRTRKALITANAFARFSIMIAQSRGVSEKEVPWSRIITRFPTIDYGAFDFSFHLKGDPTAEPSSGHALGLGLQGSGKTLLAGFLTTQALKVNPRIIMFDKDQGFESLIRALGGSYNKLQIGKKTGLNPLRTEIKSTDTSWLISWLRATMLRDENLTVKQSEALTSAVNFNAAAPEHLQIFDNFASLLTDADDEGLLSGRARQWGKEGEFGWLFGHQASDEGVVFDLSKQILGFDMTSVLAHPIERTALLGYIFRLLDKIFDDRKPTLLVIDEAWQVFDDQFFSKTLADWLVTLRKRNVVVLMLTQLPRQITNSSVGDVVVNSTQTKFIFPNPLSTEEDWRPFSLGENAVGWIRSNQANIRHAFMVSGDQQAICNVDLSSLGNLMPALAGNTAAANAYGIRWREISNFWKA